MDLKASGPVYNKINRYSVAFHNFTQFSARGFLANFTGIAGFNSVIKHVEIASTDLCCSR